MRRGTTGRTSRQRALRTYHGFSNAYASVQVPRGSMSAQEARSDPRFQQLYQDYKRESRELMDVKGRLDAARPGSRAEQLAMERLREVGRRLADTLYDLGQIDREQHKAFTNSPPLMLGLITQLAR